MSLRRGVNIFKDSRSDKKKEYRKYIWLALVLAAAFILYALNATRSGLWYDEGIEYFYSKYMTGAVPGGLGTENMLQRILVTYQPPLYNILMYLWLLIADTEFWFRLAGILVTLAGAAGCFFAIYEFTTDNSNSAYSTGSVTSKTGPAAGTRGIGAGIMGTVNAGRGGSIWAACGTLAYLLTSGVSYYALECGEYNLMLCFVAWTFCFYLRVLKRKNVASLVGFFVFACLAVYSQYGAAFVIAGMYITLLIGVLRWRNHDRKGSAGESSSLTRSVPNDRYRRLMKWFLILSGVVLVAAVVPLLVFFMLPQMRSQGSTVVSHMPYFVHNLAYDFVEGIWKVLHVMFGYMGLTGWETRITAGVLALVVVFIIALIVTRKKLVYLAVTAGITWVIYFLAVACSFYGYNTWTPEAVGCMNLGDRYCFFMIPMIVISLVCGLYAITRWIRSKSKGAFIAAAVICLAGLIAYCATDVIRVGWNCWIKDDIREITQLWYDVEGYEEKTLVHQWEEPGFYYHMRKDSRYADDREKLVDAAEMWCRNTDYDELRDALAEAGYLDGEAFYYAVPQIVYMDSFQTFLNVMEQEGYQADILYQGMSALLYLTKPQE